jgi:hypothetical protein
MKKKGEGIDNEGNGKWGLVTVWFKGVVCLLVFACGVW